MAEFTLKKLQALCARDGLYRTPSVNDKLYLHYQGFTEIDEEVNDSSSGFFRDIS